MNILKNPRHKIPMTILLHKDSTLEGKRCRPEYDKLLVDPLLKYSGLFGSGCGRGDLAASLQVHANGRALALPVHTSYKHFTSRWNWNQWITLPISYADLPRNSQLCITLYDCAGPGRHIPVGGSTISLFGKHGVFRQGMLDLKVWPGLEANSDIFTTTPGKARDHGKEQMHRLAKLAKKHRNGQISKVDWLDRLTFREIELINEQEKRASDYLYLMVEFPQITIDGIPDGDEVVQHRSQPDVVTFPDYEILQENLVEAKHHKLARSLRSGGNTKELKPTSNVRDALNTILSYPPTTALSTEEQDLIWKFRFYLSTQKKALTKFIKCVNWKVAGEERQALEMLILWAPPDPEDALELLGPAFTHPAIRRYAIERLNHALDDDLMLYLLQLVQALKYENFESIKIASEIFSKNRELIDNSEKISKEYKSNNISSSISGNTINFSNFEPIPFPLDPDISIKGIIPEKTSLFKSALMPSKLTFLTTENTEYIAIFKHGDDLRQDQLILQTIALMDKLLRRENLDLKLTPYRVLATSTRHGFLQFIESTTVAEVLANEGSILNFFRKNHPSENGPYGVVPEVMDTYIRSCAGYCIITHVLGVGDRHLDNLLLTTSGKLFHIDFGYILGRDPKPLPPPMKLSKEMHFFIYADMQIYY
ncbi:PREDICTED: phosphatidylinositol 3-kinase catalytic subunit type 3 [Ceratosolen solmsi marchali]|uniref:Phosphatidylinositol 3-kinase catalytic subunit type 3 n=1 Tax=Ceratosolen solmsi marchali TaxID=326594 RepID=A0AAJ6YRC2_9HYME|nr:PREDICTED: phosphatidylinositol 3-kinase catalytic subunit type 3 [Ceratosolen solmsi marchali]